MAYTKLSSVPQLQEGETAVALADGGVAAVAVVSRRLPNGAGASFRASARLIGKDGQSLADAHGATIESEISHQCDPLILSGVGVDRIAREVLLLVLGEEPELGAGDEPTLPPWSAEVRMNASIRHHRDVAASAGAHDASDLLGTGSRK